MEKTKIRIILEALLSIFQSAENAEDKRTRTIARSVVAFLVLAMTVLSFFPVRSCNGVQTIQQEQHVLQDGGNLDKGKEETTRALRE